MSAIYEHERDDSHLPTAVKQLAVHKPGISIARILLATILAVAFALGSGTAGVPITWAIVIGAAVGGCMVAILRAYHPQGSR